MLLRLIFISLFLPTIVFSKTFIIDKSHSYIGFKVKYMMLSSVRGDFSEFDAQVTMNAGEITEINSKIEVASISTNNKKRDKHLNSPDFFNSEIYPEIRFKAKKITKIDDDFLASGDLTIHGITKKVSIPFEMTDIFVTDKGNERFGVEAELNINRKDFGIMYSKTMDNGGLVVDDKVTIVLNVQFYSRG